MNITQISIDLAKNVFQICCVNRALKPLSNKKVSRSKLILTMENLPRCTVFMEACYSAHYWGRRLDAMGFTVKLIPAQHVTPFVRGNKNDRNDALAIIEAGNRPNLRFVPVKPQEKQDLQTLQRIRRHYITERTALSNQVRGLLSEYGIVIPLGRRNVIAELPYILEDANNELSVPIRSVFSEQLKQLKNINQHVDNLDKQILQLSAQFSDFERLCEVPGIGLQVAATLLSSIPDIQNFKTSRDLAVWIGLTPRQEASGNKSRMLGISKRGNVELRTMLIHAARVHLYKVKSTQSHIKNWAESIAVRRGAQIAMVALAHKMARIVWALLRYQTHYQESGRPAKA